MLRLQLILIWISVAGYVMSACLAIGGSIFRKPALTRIPYKIGWIALIPLVAALGLRWYQTGHFPYWGSYEVLTSYACGAAILIQLFGLMLPQYRSVVGWLAPVVFLMLGLGAMGTKNIEDIPRSYYVFWLYVHIAFAKLAYGSALLAAGMGTMFLWKTRRGTAEHTEEEPSADLKKIDGLNYALSGFAFIMLGIMIVSGAIWAYKAWGAYWRWDPIETWAFVSWLVYGIGLHLRFSMGWRGKKAAWLSIVALVLVLFAFFGIPLIYPTAHEHLSY